MQNFTKEIKSKQIHKLYNK